MIDTKEKLITCQANKDIAAWLQVPENTALLQINRIAYTYNEKPVELRQSYVNTEKYEYIAKE